MPSSRRGSSAQTSAPADLNKTSLKPLHKNGNSSCRWPNYRFGLQDAKGLGLAGWAPNSVCRSPSCFRSTNRAQTSKKGSCQKRETQLRAGGICPISHKATSRLPSRTSTSHSTVRTCAQIARDFLLKCPLGIGSLFGDLRVPPKLKQWIPSSPALPQGESGLLSNGLLRKTTRCPKPDGPRRQINLA